MTNNDQIDISQFDQPVAEIQQHVDDLHGVLDSFAAGRNDRLTGQGTKNTVYQALEGLDDGLKSMRRLRESAAPRLQGHVTAGMRHRLREANAVIESVTLAHRRMFVDFSERKLRKSALETSGYLLGELRLLMRSLEDDLQVREATKD